MTVVTPSASSIEFYVSPYYEVLAGSIPNWDDGDDMPDQWLRKCDGQNYDNERELYRDLVTEAYNRFGVCMTYYVLSYDTQYDKIYGEDNDRRFSRRFDIMAYYPLQIEEKFWSKFAVAGNDEFSLFVSKDHFREASTYGDSQVSGNIGPNTYPVYIPKTGDVVQSQYNSYLYEITNVKEEAMMIHLNKRYVWELVVRPFIDENLNLDPVTSASMAEVAKFINVKPDIFDIHNEVISAAAADAYVPKSCELPSRNPFGGW
jgi:hypothetical protein